MCRKISLLLCFFLCSSSVFSQGKQLFSGFKNYAQRSGCASCARQNISVATSGLPPSVFVGLAEQLSAAVQAQCVSLRMCPGFMRLNSLPSGQQLQAVIFDLDGTLLDSLSAWKTSSSDFLRSKGIIPPAGIDGQMAKLSLLDGAAYLKNRYRLTDTPQQIVDQVVASVAQKYRYKLELKPGVKEFLFLLKKRGIKLAVATASDRKLAESALKRTGVLDEFDFILTCDEAGAGKKEPAVFEKALSKLGTPKESTWVFEDALYALQTAKRAGFPVAAVEDPASFPYRKELLKAADRYITSFDQCSLSGE